MFFDEEQQILICGWDDVVPFFTNSLSFDDIQWIHIRDPEKLMMKASITAFKGDGSIDTCRVKLLKNEWGKLDGSDGDIGLRRVNKIIRQQEKKERVNLYLSRYNSSSRFDILDL